MSLLVTCPLCDKSFKVKDKYIGRTGGCPNCGGQITIPGATDDTAPMSASNEDTGASLSPDAPTVLEGTSPRQPKHQSPSSVTRQKPAQRAGGSSIGRRQSPTPPPQSPTPPQPVAPDPLLQEFDSALLSAGTPTLKPAAARSDASWVLYSGLGVGGVGLVAFLAVVVVTLVTPSRSSDSNPNLATLKPAASATTNLKTAPTMHPAVALVQEQIAAFESVVDVMKTIDDEVSARAASQQFADAMRQMLDVTRRIQMVDESSVPPEVEPDLQRLMPQMAALRAEMTSEQNRLHGIPGVQSILQQATAGLVDDARAVINAAQ